MVAYIIMSIFVLMIVLFIYFEYRNEKKYQENRHKRAEERNKTKPPYDPKEKIQKPLKEKNDKAVQRRAATPGAKEKSLPQVNKTVNDTYELKDTKKYVVEPRKVPSAKELREAEEKQKLQEQKLEEKRLEEQKTKLEVIPEPEVIEKIDLPECKYPKFNYSRLLKMGLGEDEAIEFVKELIPQIKTQIPLIKESMEASDFHNIERLTHSIKGSSTTVGSGGISDLLVEFNTYVKTGKEIPIIEAYVKHLNHYCEELEKEYA